LPSGTHDGPSSQVAIWAAGLLAVGAAARITRWACHFPFWYDEAAVALNLVDRGWPGLNAPMLHAQVMPFGFLAGEVLLYETLGPDELSLRLLPLLAALGSLVCFWKLTRVVAERIGFRDELGVLPPLALFAGSYYLIRYAGELKPYSLDVFFASLFLWLGAASIAAGSKKCTRTLAAAAILVGPATWLSYPVVFVAAAVSLALLPTVARAPRARLAFVAYNAALLAGFASHYLGFGLAQDAAAGESFMREFWVDSFPPADPVSLGA
jgi:hypothetical protein